MKLTPKNRKKAIEAILFVSSRLPALTRHTLAKVFYFADKKHLQGYGRLLFDDCYIAMKNGPVPSGVYDIIKNPDTLGESALQPNTGKSVRAKRPPDMRYLSESEIECLTSSINEYGHRSFDELTRLSHDSAWKSADENDEMSLEDIARTIADSDAVIEHLRGDFDQPVEDEWPQAELA